VVSTAASQHLGPRLDSWLWSLSVWSLHILPVSARGSFGCSGFLPQSKDVWVRLNGYAKLTLRAEFYQCVTPVFGRDAAVESGVSRLARFARYSVFIAILLMPENGHGEDRVRVRRQTIKIF